MRTYNVTPIFAGRALASDLWKEMDNFFDARVYSDTQEAVYDERAFGPACDVAENEHGFMMSIDLPGIKQEDIKVEVKESVLMISGERKRDRGLDTTKALLNEKSYGIFRRSFTLPKTVNAEKIEAFYEAGVLDVFIPKEEAAKPRAINIQTSKKGLLGKLLSYSQEEKEAQETH